MAVNGIIVDMESFETDPLKGAEIMAVLGLDALSIRTPENYQRYKEIVSFLGKYDDAVSIIRMVTRGTTPRERLAKVFEYTKLRQELAGIRDQIKQLPSDNLATTDQTIRKELETKEQVLLNELTTYER